MRLMNLVIIVFSLTVFVPSMVPPAAAQIDPQAADSTKAAENKDPYRQRLGLRAGYVTTGSTIKDSFGNGLDLALHWVQHIKYPLGVDLTIGAIYFGSTGRDDITISTFNQRFDKVSMRILHFTAAPSLEFGLGERTHFFVSGGGGLYTVSLLVDNAFSEADFSNSHFGVTASAGIIRRISENWFLDATFQGHKLWTSQEPSDLFWAYSDGDSNPVFYDLTIGLMLRLF